MSINISVSDSGAGSFEISQVTDTTADLNLTSEADITLDVEGGVGAPGAGNVALAAGSGISITTNGNTATIAATSQAVSSANLADLANVNTTAPSTGEVLAWSGSDWRPTADSTLTLTTSAAAALGTGAAGASTDAARADHVHDLPTFQQITSGTATTNTDLLLDPATGEVIVQGGSAGSAAITLNCEVNTHGVTIQAPPHSAGATYTLTLPDDTGTQGQVLTTSGATGALSWQNGGAGGSLTFANVPTSSESAGSTGDLSFDETFFYVRTAAGWRRSALSGWGVVITITQQPSNVQTSLGSSVTFTVAAQTSGSGVVSFQWQESVSSGEFVSILGATSSSYTFNPSSSAVNTVYRCMVMATGAQTVLSDTAVITFATSAGNLLLISSGDHLHAENGDGLLHSGNIASSLSFTTQPTNQTASSGSATFSVVVANSSSNSVSLQWQRSTNSGSSWSSLAGETSNTLSLTGLTSSDDGAQFRVLLNASGAAEAISNTVTLTIPSTTITASINDTNSTFGHSSSFTSLDIMRMSGDGTTIVGSRASNNSVSIYRQSGSELVHDQTILMNDSNDTGVAFNNVYQAQLAVSDDGDTFAIVMPNALDESLEESPSYGDGTVPMPLGKVRTYQRDSTSGTWSQKFSDISGDLYDNASVTYGGTYETNPLSEVAINNDGTKLFVLTKAEASYNANPSKIDFFETSSLGWNNYHTITAAGSAYSDARRDDDHWQGLQCNADGDEIGYIYLDRNGTSALESVLRYRANFVTLSINSSGTTHATSALYPQYTWQPESPITEFHRVWAPTYWEYEYSRDLSAISVSYRSHDQAQTSNVGKVEIFNATSSGWSSAGSITGDTQNGFMDLRGINSDGTKFVVTHSNYAERYSVTSSGITQVGSDYSPVAMTADIDDTGNRVAIYGASTISLIE